MKIFENVRSTAVHVPSIEVNVSDTGAIDTVYVRSNISKVYEDGREEWNIGREIHYDCKDFISNLTMIDESQSMALLISLLMSEIDLLKQRVETLEGDNE